jgi:TolB-like protein/Tfp pilus assembly protein PilF
MDTDQHRWRFGSFEADLRSRELTHNGTRVRLQDQPFQILALLLERRGDVVSRDELRARLWPEGTFVDFEHSLNAAIKRLRVALGDTADRPRFVETLHRRGYRFIAPAHSAAMPPVSTERAAQPRRPRLVVLPFANLSGTDQGYFADGLTEEMIAEIGRHCGGRIGVLARTSSWRFKDAPRAASEIGEALKVDYLVEGSVRREGDRVRVTATLIETRGETQLWADTYDRHVADCLAVQADIASRIAQALALELLSPAAISHPGAPPTAAYQAFLRGRYYWNMSGDDGLEQAVRYYDQAIALDPAFGKAYSARARAGISRCEYYTARPLDVLHGVRDDALKALELDPSDSEGLVALAEVHRMLDWNWSGAEATYRRALDANPNSESTHKYYALFLAARGRREATRIVDRGWELDPLCASNNTAAASVRYFSGDYESAIARCRLILDIDPTYAGARRRLASALAATGRYKEAIDEYNLIAQRLDPVSRAWLGHTLAVAGNAAAARAVAASLEQAVDGQAVPPFHLAMLYAGLNERDRAFALLDLACDEHDPLLDTLEVEPRFERLRRDARYARLMQRLQLSDVGAGSSR